jgi:hypothetical protein
MSTIPTRAPISFSDPIETETGRFWRRLGEVQHDTIGTLIAGAYQGTTGEMVGVWDLTGRAVYARDPDIRNVRQEHTAWLNIYPLSVVRYGTKEEADKHAGPSRKACIPITWHDGDGLTTT